MSAQITASDVCFCGATRVRDTGRRMAKACGIVAWEGPHKCLFSTSALRQFRATARRARPSTGKSGRSEPAGVPRRPKRLGGEIAAADGALHRCRPARGRPIAGQKQIGRGRSLRRPPSVGAWLRRKRRGGFLDDRGFQQLGCARRRAALRATSCRHRSMISCRERSTSRTKR